MLSYSCLNITYRGDIRAIHVLIQNLYDMPHLLFQIAYFEVQIKIVALRVILFGPSAYDHAFV